MKEVKQIYEKLHYILENKTKLQTPKLLFFVS